MNKMKMILIKGIVNGTNAKEVADYILSKASKRELEDGDTRVCFGSMAKEGTRKACILLNHTIFPAPGSSRLFYGITVHYAKRASVPVNKEDLSDRFQIIGEYDTGVHRKKKTTKTTLFDKFGHVSRTEEEAEDAKSYAKYILDNEDSCPKFESKVKAELGLAHKFDCDEVKLRRNGFGGAYTAKLCWYYKKNGQLWRTWIGGIPVMFM